MEISAESRGAAKGTRDRTEEEVTREQRVWKEALRLWHGDEAATTRFLNYPHQLLHGRSALDVARESDAGAERVVKIIGAARAGVAV